MTFAEALSKLDLLLRNSIVKSHPELASKFYSTARKLFLEVFSNEQLRPAFIPDESQKRILWDIEFNSRVFNAAGMFKKGESYYTVASQGAGAYLAGTTTGLYRRGNEKLNIMHPFMPYPNSASASNWMGLPNLGHHKVAKKLADLEKLKGCPIGISLSLDSEIDEYEALELLLDGFKVYDRANVDFIELNESCPNVHHEHDITSQLDAHLIDRLEYISKNFLSRRNRNLPVMIKLSNDTNPDLLPPLIDIMTDLNFGGINLGNTSIDYAGFSNFVNADDKKNFEFFSEIFQGGLSGRFLKQKSFDLCRTATDYLKTKDLKQEFHIIRTGGIEDTEDILQSDNIGVSLNQWFTSYFDHFTEYGHRLYQRLIENL